MEYSVEIGEKAKAWRRCECVGRWCRRPVTQQRTWVAAACVLRPTVCDPTRPDATRLNFSRTDGRGDRTTLTGAAGVTCSLDIVRRPHIALLPDDIKPTTPCELSLIPDRQCSRTLETLSYETTRRARLTGSHRLRNDLYCVGWGVKLYSNKTKASGFTVNRPLASFVTVGIGRSHTPIVNSSTN